MILQTARLILRPFCEDDVDLLAALMANPDFMRFSLGVRTREETAVFLQKIIGWQREGRPSQFAIILRASGTLAGLCGFLPQQVDGVDEIEIAYRLHPDNWNKGIATEATQAVRDHAFRDLALPRVISLIHLENFASRRVAEKMGMTIEKETAFKGFPTNVFAISREVWSANYGV
jgi:RimJ/RimL family protein N-acetyltransferase